MNKLLELAESEGEKQRLKFAVIRAAGLSSTKAKSIYSFDDMTSKTKKVKDALEEATAIHKVIENIAKSKDCALLNSLGIFYSDSSEGSQTDSDQDGSETDSDQDDTDALDGSDDREDNAENLTKDKEFFNNDQLLSILYQCKFNWLEFVHVTGEMRKDLPLKSVESMLDTFAARLSNSKFERMQNVCYRTVSPSIQPH